MAALLLSCAWKMCSMFTTRPTTHSSRSSAWTSPTSSWWAKCSPPIAPAPGHGQIIDHEYVRKGVAEIFLEVEPLTGRRHVPITEHRPRKDWAAFIKGMLDERYPQATKVRLVMDNLNTHSAASLYETFQPEEARRLARRL